MAERFSPANLLQNRDLVYLVNLNTRDPRTQAFKRAAAAFLSTTSYSQSRVESLGYLTGDRIVDWDTVGAELPTQILWRLGAEIDHTLELSSWNAAKSMTLMLETYIKPQISVLTSDQVDEYIRRSVTGIVARADLQ